jgi:hypothetical protein
MAATNPTRRVAGFTEDQLTIVGSVATLLLVLLALIVANLHLA